MYTISLFTLELQELVDIISDIDFAWILYKLRRIYWQTMLFLDCHTNVEGRRQRYDGMKRGSQRKKYFQ